MTRISDQYKSQTTHAASYVLTPATVTPVETPPAVTVIGVHPIWLVVSGLACALSVSLFWAYLLIIATGGRL